jgi:hypothetical protein
MIKHEIKVEMKDSVSLRNLIESAYNMNGEEGTIIGNEHRLLVNPVLDDELFRVLTGLHNSTVKVFNTEVIDGTIRFMVSEKSGEINLSPISVRCICEDRWIFY